ncbi:zinc uptake protein ZrgA [Roseivivax sp.]
MKPTVLTLVLASAAASAATATPAQEAREMGAHVHGVSTAEIAVEQGRVEITLHSPGADIVGFEYPARSTEEKEAVAAAIRQFLAPETIVTLPEPAGCRLTEVVAQLHGGGHDDAQDANHAESDDHGHDHDTHAEGEDHAHEAGEDHDHDAHGEDDDHDHAEEHSADHSEFHVTYGFACDEEDALTTLGFPFFETFGNAREIEVQYVTEAGAGLAALTPGAAELTLE